MILQWFRRDHLGRHFILPFLIIALWLPAIVAPVTVRTHPGIGLYPGLHAFVMSNWPGVWAFLSMITILLTAYLLDLLVERIQFYQNRNLLPGLIYALTMSTVPAQFTFHPLVPANFFLTLALWRLYSVDHRTRVIPLVYDAGFFTGVAATFFFPYIFLFPVIWIGLILIRSFNWREFLLPMLGTGTPFLLVWTYRFWMDTPLFITTFRDWGSYEEFFHISDFQVFNSALLILFGLLLLAGLYHLLRSFRERVMLNKKQQQIFLAFFLLLSGIFYLSAFIPDLAYRLSIMALPFALLFPFFLSHEDHRRASELLFTIWFLLVATGEVFRFL